MRLWVADFAKRGSAMLKSLFSAFLMYSKIPMPKCEWKEENRRYALGFFPLVGVVIGVMIILWRLLCDFLETGPFIFSAGAVFLPVLITGGIHIDGFCDVTDARASYADSQKRLAILADPHIGSFAIIRTCLYFLMQAAFFSRIVSLQVTALIGCGYVLSRALSGSSAILCRSAKTDGTLQSLIKPSHKKITLCMELFFTVVSAIFMVILYPLIGLICLIVSGIVLLYCKKIAYKEFGGYTGDICGWFLQLCELAHLAAFVWMKLILEATKWFL